MNEEQRLGIFASLRDLDDRELRQSALGSDPFVSAVARQLLILQRGTEPFQEGASPSQRTVKKYSIKS